MAAFFKIRAGLASWPARTLAKIRTLGGESSVHLQPALEEEGLAWHVHDCRNIRLFNDSRLFAAYGRDQHLIKNLLWKKDTVDEPEDYIRAKRKYVPKSFRPPLLAMHAKNATANYYHWMFDVLPRLHLYRRAFPGEEPAYWLFSGPVDLPYKAQTLDLLGIPASRRLDNSKHHHLECQRIFITDPPQKRGPGRHVVMPEWICRFLRDSFLPFARESSGLPRRIYISRADSKVGRKVINEPEVVEMLATFNVQPVTLGKLSFVEQLSLFAGAEIVVGAHGAGFSNSVFCRPGTVILELFHADYVNGCYGHIAFRCGLRHTFLEYATPDTAGTREMAKSILVDAENLKQTIASLLAA